MKLVWAAQWWRVSDSWALLRRDLGRLLSDLAVVGWCQLRLAHRIEPSAEGLEVPEDERTEPVHRWCASCGWCVDCRERRVDLLRAVEVSWP